MNKVENKKAFVGFLTAGDPSLEKTAEFIIEMEKAGADCIEIGIPFSDPIAEGAVIQGANVRALSAAQGCTTDMVFDMVKNVRRKVSVPLVFYVYLNQVYKYGYEAFCKKCKETGISGIRIPDMPYEEKAELVPIAEQYGVDIISMIAPADKKRVQMIAGEAKGYIHAAVSDEKAAEELLAAVREVTNVPVVLDMDALSDLQSAEYMTWADGCIIAGEIVMLIEKYGVAAGKYIHEFVAKSLDKMQETQAIKRAM